MMFHDGEVHRVASRKLTIPEDNLFRTLGNTPINAQHLIDNPEQSVKCWLDRISAVDCNVAVQDLLKHFGICDQTLAVADQFLEPLLCIALMRMGRAYEIHRDVGIDQDHGCSSGTYPLSISASMPPMSLTG